MAYGLYSPMGALDATSLVARLAAVGLDKSVIDRIGDSVAAGKFAEARSMMEHLSPAQLRAIEALSLELITADPKPEKAKTRADMAMLAREVLVAKSRAFMVKVGVGVVAVGLIAYVARKHWR